MWQVNNHFHVTASPRSRLPNGFCRNITRPNMFAFEDAIPIDSPELVFEKEN